MHHCTKLKLWAALCSEESGLLTLLLWSTCTQGGPHFIALHTWTVVGIPLWMRDQREELPMFLFYFFLLFLSINIHLLWTQKYLCQYEESSGKTFLHRGKYTPWRNCWGTMDSMDWLLLSKRVNVVCVFVHLWHPTGIVMKTTVISFNYPSHHFHADLYIQGLVFSKGLGLVQNICLLRKEH